MATYTQLGGQGVPTEELSGEKTFLFGNSLDATVYFTMEQVRNADGFYSGSIARNAEGTFGSFTGLDENDLINLTKTYKSFDVMYPSIGENFSFLKRLVKKDNLNINFIVRKEDEFCWKFSNKGYFNFKSNIPIILSTFKLN